MKTKIMFPAVLMLAAFIMAIAPVSASEIDTCVVYFTATFCPNCEYTDPVVLRQWTAENPNLVVVEYMFSSWTEENAGILGQYAQKYSRMAAVPHVFVDAETAMSGRMEVPNVDIESINGNGCLLLDGQPSFEEMDISALPGNPLKLWSKGRLLVRTGESDIPDEFIKELLTTENLDMTLGRSSYDIEGIDPEPAPISGGQISFGKAVKIGNSWTLKVNEDINVPCPTNETDCDDNVVELPFFGKIDISQTPIPVLTVLIGLADGFNPCAFFILSFLLSAMVYAMSRKRILIVGGIFVFFSALVYFLFMSAWLNVFLLAPEIMMLTFFAGLVAVVAGLINIKDFFFFKKGISLTLPTKDKIRFSKRVEDLVKGAKSMPALIGGTILIAATVNMYELLCTVGFPMVYTRILTLQNLPPLAYYGYLALYNVMYVIPIALVVAVFALTLGSKQFSVDNVKNLKLFSGIIIFLFGMNLIINPNLLENVVYMFLIIAISIIVSVLIIITKCLFFSNDQEEKPPEPADEKRERGKKGQRKKEK